MKVIDIIEPSSTCWKCSAKLLCIGIGGLLQMNVIYIAIVGHDWSRYIV